MLTKLIGETTKRKQKNQKDRFLPMLLGTTAASILANALSGSKEFKSWSRINHSWWDFFLLVLSHFEIQKYYQNEPEFNGVYLRNNLSKIKDVTHIINLDEFESIGTHWIASYLIAENVTYFDSFAVEHMPKKNKNRKFIENKTIITNIYRIQVYSSMVCRYFCIGCIDFMLEGTSSLEYSDLFPPNKYNKNDKIIL